METHENSADDSWSSLAQELGLGDEPTPAQSAAAEIEPHLSDLPDADDGEDTALEPGLNSEPTAESAEETGEDGNRRRRRRRRRRKGGPVDVAGEPTGESAESYEEGDDEPVAASTETSADIAMRDVVANWNVPSWDELIGGLYRPGN